VAVPTITAVSPNNGKTKGDNIIFIEGTNFRLPEAPPPLGYLGGDQQKTVSVKFEGQESNWAYSAADEKIIARVPEYLGPHDVPYPVSLDVRVANLDNDGNEIPGENATLTDGYSVDRPNLAAQSYMQRVIRTFQHMFKRHVLLNTFISSSRDAPSKALDDERFKAMLPAIFLIGPRTNVNRFKSSNLEDEQHDQGEWNRRRFPVTLDFEFDLEIHVTKTRHLFGLEQALILLFRDKTELTIDNDPNDPSKGSTEYEITMDWETTPATENEPNQSDVLSSTAIVKIEGVHVDDEDGTIVERGWDIDSSEVFVQFV